MKKLFSNTIVILLLAVVFGIGLGYAVNDGLMKIILVIKQICGQVIFFMVPLIIIGFIAPSIAALKDNVSRLISFAFALAYTSSVGAALFAAAVSYKLIPLFDIQTNEEGLRALPEVLFKLEIPPVMSVMSALLLSVMLGLGVIWAKADGIAELLRQFQKMVLKLVERILIPILPVFIAANFCALTYEGSIGQLKIFLPVILIVIICHYIWLAFLYIAASLYSGKNGWLVLKHYLPAYLTALGTMSSAATLGVALECAGKSPVLDKEVRDFSVPLFANIHLCGSVLTETCFVCVVSQLLYGHLPPVGTLVLFIILLGIFAVGAPGVPGGTVLASLGIVISVLGFNEAGTALLIAIFALQDSFGTACNVTGDGALTLMVNTFKKKGGEAGDEELNRESNK
ncbi:dicarboxylate/amino acid:cation symporter [bacterium]|nr:dicarboxylate/amino acid:cation symporter [bacterium]